MGLGRLSETEMEVMQTIWESGEGILVSHLLAIFEAKKGWKTSTLSTILKRLIDKGYLTKEMTGKTNVYTPTLTVREYQKYETRAFMDRVHGNNVKSFISALADENGLTLDDIDELKKWLQTKGGDAE